MRKIASILGLFGLVFPLWLNSQTADIPLNSEVYHLIDRVDIQNTTEGTVHTDVKPYAFSYGATVLNDAQNRAKTKKEKAWYGLAGYLVNDSLANAKPTKGILKTFYTNKRDLFAHSNKELSIYVNPIFFLSPGGDLNDFSGTRTGILNYRNTRGLVVRGTAFGKLGFYTEVADNQAKYPEYIKRYNNALPGVFGEGFFKSFSGNGFDFFSARGYLTYSPFSKMRIKFGKDRLFLGNGYQSLFLSDNATDYIFLNINTKIWKLEYVNHFAQMVDVIPFKPDTYGAHPRKYSVYHQLSIKPTRNISFSIFESIVYTPQNPGGRRGFELEYLNPIIFYRSAEQFIGSPDNGFIGFQGKYNFLKRFQLYGQILIDDFNWRLRKTGVGWWGNKYGYQAGLKYINAFFIPRLDLQLEYNRIRPYTYQHFNPSSSYTHYRQYLAHALGSNLSDFTVIARYQVIPRLGLTGVASIMKKGLDANGLNMGGDPFQTNLTHPYDFNNTTLQGNLLSIINLNGRISYQIKRLNAFAEIEATFRKENSFSSISGMGTLRMNIPVKPVKF